MVDVKATSGGGIVLAAAKHGEEVSEASVEIACCDIFSLIKLKRKRRMEQLQVQSR